jgi:hypothetical protein
MARDSIEYGFDAQPIANFDKMKALGGTYIHRYDPGGNRSITLRMWIDENRRRGQRYIVQGTRLEAANTGVTWEEIDSDPLCLAVSQDDEPDLNRYDNDKNKFPEEVLQTRMYTPTTSPHKGRIGWTLPSILQERYDRWKTKLPNKPILVNFAGPSMTNGYYWDGAGHKPYMKAADRYSFDLYPKNTGGVWHLYQHVLCIEKMKLWAKELGRDPTSVEEVYVESVDSVLDNEEGGGRLRGPTPNEQSAMVFGSISRGVFRITYWTQQIGRDNKTGESFDYWNLTKDNSDRIVRDGGIFKRYQRFFITEPVSIVQSPPAQLNQNKGPIVWPNSEVVTWKIGEETLVAQIDYTGMTDVVFSGTAVGSLPVGDEKDEHIKALQATVSQLVADKAGLEQILAATKSQLGETQLALTQRDATIDFQTKHIALQDMRITDRNVRLSAIAKALEGLQ